MTKITDPTDKEVLEKISPLLDNITRNIMVDTLKYGDVESACRTQRFQLIEAGIPSGIADALLETVLAAYVNFKKQGVILRDFATEKELVAAYKKSLGGDVTAAEIRTLTLENFEPHIAAEYGVELDEKTVWIRNFGYARGEK